MSLWSIVAALLTLTATYAYVNHRLLRLPSGIGVMTAALIFSLGLLALHTLGLEIDRPLRALMRQVHFDSTLLFADALSVDVPGLMEGIRADPPRGVAPGCGSRRRPAAAG